MRTRRLRACLAAIFLVAVRATTTITVDDNDPGIEYRGDWIHNPISDPKNFNYGGSMTFTNVSGSTATYKFRGTAVAVYGAFEVGGTFAMQSSYSIDGGTAMEFMPASTVLKAAYRQKFFQSDTLSDGEHTLVITNLGREFWLDYILVAQASLPATTSAASTAPLQAQTPPTSTAGIAPSTTEPATTSSAGQPETTQPVSSPSSQAQSTHSFSNADNVTLTSMDTATTSFSLQASSATQSPTSILASGAASPTTSTATRAHSSKLPAGAIAGLAVAGLLVLVLIALAGYKCRRRRQARRRRDLTPYDPGLTALAFESSGKRDLVLDGKCRDSTATSLLSLPQPGPAYAHPPVETHASETSASGERSVPRDIRTTDLGETAGMGGDRRTGFEPLGSPSSASPLLPRHPRGMRSQKDPPIAPSAGTSCYLSPVDDRRRSMDGGVRLAGGPMDTERQEGDRGDDARSGLSTLPPAYGLYPSA